MVDKQTQKLIESTVDATVSKLNSITTIDRMKAMKEETFKNTEKLLYNYKALKEHVEDEKGYFDMMHHGKSKSIVRYSSSGGTFNEDEMLRSRSESFERSRCDLKRVEKALSKIKNKKEYKVIELRYFTKKDDGETYTYEEISEFLGKDEKTIRTWKNKLVNYLAVCIFGSDAI